MSCWQLEGTVGRLGAGAWRGVIDLAQPAQGLELRIDGAADSAPWHILGVRFDDAQKVDAGRLDAYMRGNDLVATYDEIPPRSLRAQIYWRRLQGSEFSPRFAEHVPAAWDLIVSVNTSLLDSDPQSSVVSTISAIGPLFSIAGDSELSHLSIQEFNDAAPATDKIRGFLARPAAGKFSYVEIAHPAESCRSEARWLSGLESDKHRAVQLERHLFQERLEKGVILRAWIRAALVARNEDESTALAAFQHFAAAEPPLTV